MPNVLNKHLLKFYWVWCCIDALIQGTHWWLIPIVGSKIAYVMVNPWRSPFESLSIPTLIYHFSHIKLRSLFADLSLRSKYFLCSSIPGIFSLSWHKNSPKYSNQGLEPFAHCYLLTYLLRNLTSVQSNFSRLFCKSHNGLSLSSQVVILILDVYYGFWSFGDKKLQLVKSPLNLSCKSCTAQLFYLHPPRWKVSYFLCWSQSCCTVQ